MGNCSRRFNRKPAFVDISNAFIKAPDEGKEVRAVFCDISKSLTTYDTRVFSINLTLLALLALSFSALKIIE